MKPILSVSPMVPNSTWHIKDIQCMMVSEKKMNKLAACSVAVNKIFFPLHGDKTLQLRFLNCIKL